MFIYMFISVSRHDVNGAENGKLTGMILIDLRKFFDTLDHKNFSEKMKCIGLLDHRIK